MRGATANRRAISLFPIPSAASRTMRLRCATRTGVVRRRDSFSNASRVSELNSIDGATRTSGHLIVGDDHPI